MASNKRRPAVIGNLLTSGGHRCPTSPFELTILSPTGLVNCDLAGVGLAIVAALHNTTPKHRHRHRRRRQTSKQQQQEEEEEEEEYTTIVTRHNMPNNSYITNFLNDDAGFVCGGKRRETCLFDISPTLDQIKCYPPPDFLTCCHLCNKKLHGKDIFMYRGEKAFCSIECRSRKIGMDERREKHCSTEAVSSSSHHGHMLSTRMFAL